MKVKINGYDCEMTVTEFAEWQAVNAPKTTIINDPAAPELPLDNVPEGCKVFKSERQRKDGFKRALQLKMPSGEMMHFYHVYDLMDHFPELGKDYSALGGFSATDRAEYTRKQAHKLYSRLKPENKFAELIRYTTSGKRIVAIMKDGGRRVVVEVTEGWYNA